MDYNNDIVARLRVLTKTLLLGDFKGLAETTESAADEIERLRKERDEARRMYLASTCSDDEIIHEMKRHKWDCFKENTND